MGDQQENIPKNMEQPIFENEDVRAGNGEQARAWHVDFTTSLRDLFAPIATSSHSCIVLPPTNATHFNMKPHVIQLLPSFHGLDHENPYGHVKKFKDIAPHSNSRTFLKSLSTLYFSLSLFTIEPRHGWIPTRSGLLHLGKACWVSFTISFSRCLKWMSTERRLAHSPRKRVKSFSRVGNDLRICW